VENNPLHGVFQRNLSSEKYWTKIALALRVELNEDHPCNAQVQDKKDTQSETEEPSEELLHHMPASFLFFDHQKQNKSQRCRPSNANNPHKKRNGIDACLVTDQLHNDPDYRERKRGLVNYPFLVDQQPLDRFPTGVC